MVVEVSATLCTFSKTSHRPLAKLVFLGRFQPVVFCAAGQASQLVNGAALARAGRTTAANFAELKPEDIYAVQQSRDSSWVAFANTGAVSPLNRSLAL